MTFRALHYVLKIPNRCEAVNFYTNVLGMKVLRHEEFVEGCKAACNGYVDITPLILLHSTQPLRRHVE